MKNTKNFKFDARHTDLIKRSLNDFENDTVKAIAANDTVGGATPIVYKRVIYLRVIYSRIIIVY